MLSLLCLVALVTCHVGSAGDVPATPTAKQWIDKMDLSFHRMDSNQDAYVGEDEYMYGPERADKCFKQRHKTAREMFAFDSWYKFWSTEDNGYIDKIDSSEHLQVARKWFADAGYKEDLRKQARDVIFDSAANTTDPHTDQDELTKVNYECVMLFFNVPEADHEESFNFVDADDSGTIKEAELVDAVMSYFFNDTETSLLLGHTKTQGPMP